MKISVKNINEIPSPPSGFGYLFIDRSDNILKLKKQNSIVEYTNTLSGITLLDLNDYTSFEVFVHKDDIAGTNDRCYT